MRTNVPAPVAPLFRWPGGKRWLANWLVESFPPDRERYFEPFLGGGAVYFRLQPTEATLSDANVDLIECLTAVRDEPEAVIAKLAAMPQGKETYRRVRRTRPRSSAGRAARFIYLSNLAFNGIYRVNRDGRFNVPYSGRRYPSLRDGDVIRAASSVLATAEILACDFEVAVRGATPKDLCYFDPPYTVAHENNGFLKYNQRIFSWDDQVRLAAVARRLADRGCYVAVSSAAHESVRPLYSDFREVRLSRASVVSASTRGRAQVGESVFLSWD
ncbi:Dam family site-specific DNA-(adenine-N6)-methyltransferase [Microbacterium sp.]|uniref:DNA adenine methylase n=1 Tax=Microbacterium sp. TaxID=51671 RepID=UPI0031FEDA3D|nr:Dam family site-specific DNA-(adenine-N6)-methyltransferase [Microbacterium sp.]